MALVSRDASRSVPEHELTEMFRKLIQLRSKTDPHRGARASVKKRNRAIEAVDLSMELVRGLSGWAFDQLAGGALMQKKSPNWYGHEFAGRRISKRDLKKDPLRSRIPLAVMMLFSAA